MAGIYLHIPFCKQACYYCNFHFSTNQQHREQVVEAMVSEIESRKDYLDQEDIHSVYFGGGTPSLLSEAQLDTLLNVLYKHFRIQTNAEITLETNPDDLNPGYLQYLQRTPVNRLSLGVQSFFDEELQWMNRAHSGQDALTAIQTIQDKGWHQITIDLIYGSPTLTDEKWKANLQQAIDLQLQHISSYCLTVEPQTALSHFIKEQKYPPLNEEQAHRQFNILIDALETAGFEQYEISNFARNGQYAIHNSNYWKNKSYLGIGPSAHSFNQHSRSSNIAHNLKYINGIKQGTPYQETEILSITNRVNEYIMTSLRTIWGFDAEWFTQTFGLELGNKIESRLMMKMKEGLIEKNNASYRLKRESRILADGIASDLFLI